ncbi:hypothetical protein FSP39_008439 [Pinctada imbricata]|uniref:SOCS box domain-containing protein n=1 Tax=Pinctada imbricata TaxID=66713 RepID=A0AA89BNW5_PINIB|nr:hypothetical protein FSP39_008439 [Pinctada imbricata]
MKSVSHWIEDGANLHSKWEGWTPLTYACESGNMDVTECLVKNLKREDESVRRNGSGNRSSSKSSLNEYNEYGDTALTCAARNGHLEICKLLLHNGACVNLTSQYSHQSVLHIAIEQNQEHIIEFLLANGADVQIVDNVKITPLYTAIKGRNSCIIQRLLAAGCDVNKGSQDHSPLFLATRLGLSSVVEMLCEADCDIDLAVSHGVTPVYEATMKGHDDILQYLIDRGCDVNKTDRYGTSPFHVACMYRNVIAVNALLKGGADVNVRMQQGQTGLLVAMEKNNADIVELLLSRGVPLMIKPHSTSLSAITKVFDNVYTRTVEVLIRGCPDLILPHSPGVSRIIFENFRLLQMVLLSGIKLTSGVLTVVRLHPDYVGQKDVSVWLQNFHKNPHTLMNSCRIRIRQSLGNKLLCSVRELPIPVVLQDFICLKDI